MKRVVFPAIALLIPLVRPALADNAATWVRVETSVNRRAINPLIYGTNFANTGDITSLNTPLNRRGGNATTRYNWQLDAHSAGADWYFETYADSDGSKPGADADAFIAATHAAGNGAEPMITIPMIDYLANLGPDRTTLEGFSVRKYGAQKATDPYNSDAGNGVLSSGSNVTGNDPLDSGTLNSATIQQGWVQHLVSTYGSATSATGIKYYILDNEPSLWHSTHRDVHPTPLGYDELWAKLVAYATAIRAIDPNAQIVAGEEWNWWAMYASGFDQANGLSKSTSNYNTHSQTYYYPWLLQKLAAYKQQTGVQLVDIFTVHGYNNVPDGSDDSTTGRQLRNRETRMLWDPNYKDPSWLSDLGLDGGIPYWIPRLRAWVNQYYPGLKIGFTEYSWGDEANLNGATTQADVLGIYGREGLDLATRWGVAKTDWTFSRPSTYYVTHLASQIYRNYDGNNSTFGDTSVSAAVDNPDNLSAFAAVRSSDGALTVMVINKQQGAMPVTVSFGSFTAGSAAQAWQINSAAQTAIARVADVSVTHSGFTTTVPSQSITLFIVPSAGATPTGSTALINISTRAYCTTGNGVTIGGFVVSGSAPKRVLIRAVGPTLTTQGIGASEALTDPTLELHDTLNNNLVIAVNDNWGDNANPSDITAAAAQVGAAPLANGDTTSSALLLTLNPGVYSFVVRGKNSASGIVLIEAYDADTGSTAAHFVNIASRAYCTTGNGVAIGGFVIAGSAPKRLLLRATGPSLTNQGLSAAEVLADPTLEVHDVFLGNTVIAANDNWSDNTNAADITATAARVGGQPLLASDTKSSALLITLPPGVYSFVVHGATAAPNGIVLLEVYDAD